MGKDFTSNLERQTTGNRMDNIIAGNDINTEKATQDSLLTMFQDCDGWRFIPGQSEPIFKPRAYEGGVELNINPRGEISETGTSVAK